MIRKRRQVRMFEVIAFHSAILEMKFFRTVAKNMVAVMICLVIK